MKKFFFCSGKKSFVFVKHFSFYKKQFSFCKKSFFAKKKLSFIVRTQKYQKLHNVEAASRKISHVPNAVWRKRGKRKKVGRAKASAHKRISRVTVNISVLSIGCNPSPKRFVGTCHPGKTTFQLLAQTLCACYKYFRRHGSKLFKYYQKSC